MTYFNASFGTVLIRYYLMMGIIVGAFFIGYPLLAFLAFPVFLAAFMGINFGSNKKNESSKTVTVTVDDSSEYQQAA